MIVLVPGGVCGAAGPVAAVVRSTAAIFDPYVAGSHLAACCAGRLLPAQRIQNCGPFCGPGNRTGSIQAPVGSCWGALPRLAALGMLQGLKSQAFPRGFFLTA